MCSGSRAFPATGRHDHTLTIARRAGWRGQNVDRDRRVARAIGTLVLTAAASGRSGNQRIPRRLVGAVSFAARTLRWRDGSCGRT
jgi:hypothetical protein